jgi:hypothetical protein
MRRVVHFAALIGAALTSSCSTESQICRKMDSLCGTPREECQELIKSTQQSFGQEGVEGLKTCFAEAASCGEAGGCVAGRGLKSLGNAMGEFLKGLGKGLDEKK